MGMHYLAFHAIGRRRGILLRAMANYFSLSSIFFVVVLTTSCYSFSVCAASVTNSTANVLILGAGMSGIGFAEGLSRAGFENFLILEGRNKVGGRVRNAEIANTVVGLGPGWIHDTGPANVIWKLAHKYNITYHPDNYLDLIVRNGETGKVIPGAQKEEQRMIAYLEAAEKLAKKRKKHGLGNPSFLSTLAMVGWKAHSLMEKAIQFFMADFENGEGAELCSSVPISWTGQGVDVIVTDPRGYEIVPQILSQPFINKIHFNKTVAAIDYSGDVVAVTTVDGETYHANFVVVTFSSGIMNSGRIKFHPSLPGWKKEAYELVPLCDYCKFFLQFRINFWDDNNYIILGNEFKGDYVHFQSFDRPGLAAGKHILLATLTGALCREGEAMTEQDFINGVMKKLRNVYGKKIPNPVAVVRSNWTNDPFTLGSYSNPVPGAPDELYDMLQSPVEKRLWFTGEATAGTEWYGYVHGAYMAGLAQSERFLHCMSTGECHEYSQSDKTTNN